MAQPQIRTQTCVWPTLVGAPLSGTSRHPSRSRAGSADRAILLVGATPAGDTARLLERALGDAGLDPDALPHVEWPPIGASPARLIVALGAATASAVLRRPIALAMERGRVLALPHGGRLLATEHPAAILSLVDGVARGREYRRLVNDLLHAVPYQRRAA